MIRLYNPEPLSKLELIEGTNDNQKLKIVLSYYRIVHLLAAAESLAFAHHLKLPLEQLVTLANDAAGGSAMFKKFGPAIVELLTSRGEPKEGGSSINDLLQEMEIVLDAGKEVRCPLFLGSAAYDILARIQRHVGGSTGEAGVVKWWV